MSHVCSPRSTASRNSSAVVSPRGISAGIPKEHRVQVSRTFLELELWSELEEKKHIIHRSHSFPAIPVSIVLNSEGELVPVEDSDTAIPPLVQSPYLYNLRTIGSLHHYNKSKCNNKRCYWYTSKSGCNQGWYCSHCHYCSPLAVKGSKGRRGRDISLISPGRCVSPKTDAGSTSTGVGSARASGGGSGRKVCSPLILSPRGVTKKLKNFAQQTLLKPGSLLEVVNGGCAAAGEGRKECFEDGRESRTLYQPTCDLHYEILLSKDPLLN